MTPLVRGFDIDGNIAWETARPARVESIARFGAEPCELSVDFHAAEPIPEIELGDGVELWIDGALKFRGQAAELRRRSTGAPLSVRAFRRLDRLHRYEVRGLFTNQTPEQILSAIIDPLPGLSVSSLVDSGRMIDRLDLRGIPLFYTVDLLAKLAGNILWSVDWDGNLRWTSPESEPEHVWCFDPDAMVIHPGESDRSIKNEFRFLGGVSGTNEFTRFFGDFASRARFGPVAETLYVRAVTTETPYLYLRESILAQAPLPVSIHAVDRYDGDIAATFGDRFALHGPGLPEGIPSGSVFRIAAEEITWTEEIFRVRYHLAERFESASRFTRYIDHDPAGLNYVASQIGPFTLDVSALDSESHLDA